MSSFKVLARNVALGILTASLSANSSFAQEPAADTKPVVIATTKDMGAFTLGDALNVALNQSPRLKAYGSGVAAAQGESKQAGAWQNPEVGYALENFGGGAAYKAISPRQHSYTASQLVEVGGKISARKDVAGKGVDIARLDYRSTALDVIRDVTIAYMQLVTAQENIRLAREQRELAQDVLKSVGVRVDAAASPLIQKSRAQVELSTASIALDTAIRECDIARATLVAVMGGAANEITIDSSALFDVSKPKDLPAEGELISTPDLQRLGTALEQSKARLDLEKANAIPDPRFTVGVIDLPSANDKAFVAGVSLPIPVFNANRGNIEKARNDIARVEQENKDKTLLLSASLTQARQQMDNAYLRAQTLKKEVLPSAQQAFKLAREGYGLGRFPYLEVLDAQRSLFGVKQQHIVALKDYHIAKAQVERLTAVHLSKIEEGGPDGQ